MTNCQVPPPFSHSTSFAPTSHPSPTGLAAGNCLLPASHKSRWWGCGAGLMPQLRSQSRPDSPGRLSTCMACQSPRPRRWEGGNEAEGGQEEPPEWGAV